MIDRVSLDKIGKEIDSSVEFEYAMRHIMDALIVKNKDLNDIRKMLQEYKSKYRHCWELLTSLKLDDDLLEVIKTLCDRIYTYQTVQDLIRQAEDNEKILSASKTLKCFNDILKEVHDNPGISEDELFSRLIISPEEFGFTMHRLTGYGLISYSYSYKNEEYSYYLTSTGIKYNKILNKD